MATTTPTSSSASFGTLLRGWRQQRRLSQLDLALDSEVSARHLSFVETGRSAPSRDMVLRLAERLDVPLRERNALLMAAGYAPLYSERPLADPSLQAARRAVEVILQGHAHFPAIAVDRHWNLVQANGTARLMMQAAHPSLLQGQINVLRVSLHPMGLAPNILNLTSWRHHLLARLHRQIEASGDAVLRTLMDELREYPVPAQDEPLPNSPMPEDWAGVAMPLRYRTPLGVLNAISTMTVFGTPMDITLSELALETFFPADQASAALLRTLAAAGEAATASSSVTT